MSIYLAVPLILCKRLNYRVQLFIRLQLQVGFSRLPRVAGQLQKAKEKD